MFAALGSLRKKKKSDKEQQGSSKSSKSSSKKKQEEEEEKRKQEVFWAPTPLTVKSWADVDDEDDDDYYATTAPPQAIWSGADPEIKPKESSTPIEVRNLSMLYTNVLRLY